jgi:hypothetical protein
MKIKKSQLKQIIQEEIEDILLDEGSYLSPEDLIRFITDTRLGRQLGNRLGLTDELSPHPRLEPEVRLGRRSPSVVPSGPGTESAADVLQRTQSDMAAYRDRLEGETGRQETLITQLPHGNVLRPAEAARRMVASADVTHAKDVPTGPAPVSNLSGRLMSDIDNDWRMYARDNQENRNMIARMYGLDPNAPLYGKDPKEIRQLLNHMSPDEFFEAFPRGWELRPIPGSRSGGGDLNEMIDREVDKYFKF